MTCNVAGDLIKQIQCQMVCKGRDANTNTTAKDTMTVPTKHGREKAGVAVGAASPSRREKNGRPSTSRDRTLDPTEVPVPSVATCRRHTAVGVSPWRPQDERSSLRPNHLQAGRVPLCGKHLASQGCFVPGGRIFSTFLWPEKSLNVQILIRKITIIIIMIIVIIINIIINVMIIPTPAHHTPAHTHTRTHAHTPTSSPTRPPTHPTPTPARPQTHTRHPHTTHPHINYN